MSRHMAHDDSFDEDDDGFMTPHCVCGWRFGPVPGREEVVDVLMEHAFEAGAASVSDGTPREGV